MLYDGIALFKSCIMKRIILTFLMLIAFVSLSQTNIREVRSEDIFTSKSGDLALSKFTIDTAVRYCLLFRDEQYDYINDFKYLMFDDTLQIVNFMTLAKSSIKTLKEYQFMLGEEYVYFRKHFYQGLTVYAKDGWFSLTYKNADELVIKLRDYEKN